MLLDGHKALVTGASSGIGAATARRLAREGASVVVNYFSDKERGEAEAVVEDIRRAGGWGLIAEADVGNEQDVASMVAHAVQNLGGLTILVNNAGVVTHASTLALSLQAWERVLRTNLTGAFLCLREAGRVMASGGGGVIINVSSIHEFTPLPGAAHYSASKGGLRQLTQTAALELAPKGIRVVSVAPGMIYTPINLPWLDDPLALRAALDEIPLGRIGTADDVAAMVAWLASEDASYVTGATFVVDGGLSLNAITSPDSLDKRQEYSSG
jgi:glucose 1-dehydrogenase